MGESIILSENSSTLGTMDLVLQSTRDEGGREEFG